MEIGGRQISRFEWTCQLRLLKSHVHAISSRPAATTTARAIGTLRSLFPPEPTGPLLQVGTTFVSPVDHRQGRHWPAADLLRDPRAWANERRVRGARRPGRPALAAGLSLSYTAGSGLSNAPSRAPGPRELAYRFKRENRNPLMRAPGGPRLLLRRLREVMAEPVTAQARLDRIVVLIASNMVAEVCSLYVARADGPFELFATEGLNREAVHLTTMRPGEGLVGLIAATAEPLALSDAQAHPAFSYKPETGEEIYQSFLGVPVLRGGSTLGVLVVQNRARRTYSEEEIEALQTTAMLLAEMIASGEFRPFARRLRHHGPDVPCVIRRNAC